MESRRVRIAKCSISRSAAGFRQESSRVVERRFALADGENFCREMRAKGIMFTVPPKKQDFGGVLTQVVDSESPHSGVGSHQ